MFPELVIFDCDGVLIDSEVIACSADADVLTAAGYPITVDQVVARFLGVKTADMLTQIECEMGKPLPDNTAMLIEQRVQKSYYTDLNVIPGVATTVKESSWRSCVASSSQPAKLNLGLIETGLFDLFYPNIFSASLVENGKPAPDLFLFAAAKMEAEADKCVVIEDSIAGVQAGCAAGMTVLGFTGGSHYLNGHEKALYDAGAVAVFDSYQRLPELLGQFDRIGK